MLKASEAIIETLSARGHRITEARKGVINLLAESHTALTIQALAERAAADEASVYRTMHLLLAEGLVEEIQIRGQRSRFALVGPHHHHAICRSCGTVAHVPCAEVVKLPKVASFHSLDEHEVTFYGLCNACS